MTRNNLHRQLRELAGGRRVSPMDALCPVCSSMRPLWTDRQGFGGLSIAKQLQNGWNDG